MLPRIWMFATMVSFGMSGCLRNENPVSNIVVPVSDAALKGSEIAIAKDPEVMVRNCNICHNPASVSHDAIIAPPFAAVKRRYSRVYKDEEKFVTALMQFVKNPTQDKVIMYGAKDRFGLMPKLVIDDDSLRAIAVYLYSQNPEEPAWFKDHMGGY